jgi:uncharacterized membrane protein YozB (DUF420 family)
MFTSIQGFLGTGAPFSADFNLIVQLAMGLALAAGAVLARRKLYRAHAICQTTVLLMNMVMIAVVMWPSFQQQIAPALPRHLARLYYFVAAAHGALGIGAELLGLYILLAAGTKVLPRRLQFRRWKAWMRAELTLWWMVVITGVCVYHVWYAALP